MLGSWGQGIGGLRRKPAGVWKRCLRGFGSLVRVCVLFAL